MKLSVSKEKLLEGLQTVQNVVSTRTTLPILSNVLLEAAEGQLRLTTTDLDVGMRGAIEAAVEKPGATTLPARRLFTIVRELPSAEIMIEVDAKSVASIRCGPSYFKILGLPEADIDVIDADLGLNGGDLRAAERTFQLLSQVAGRAGRAAQPAERMF